MPLYLFTNESFSLAVSRDQQGRTLPAGQWRLLKEVDPREIDPAIVERVSAAGHWFYQPGQQPGGGAKNPDP